MKIQEIKELTMEELKQKELTLREELFNLKFQHATGQHENVMRHTQIKRDIARILTIANQKKREKAAS